MIQYLFHYANKAHRVLTLQFPVSQEVLATLAHDFRATLYRQVSVTLPVSKEQRKKNRTERETAQYAHKAFKKSQPKAWVDARNEVLRALATAKTPNWADFRLNLTENGI